MNYIKIDPCTTSEYHGWSTSLWLSGCDHMCKGCFNKTAWKSSSGDLFTEDVKSYLFSCVAKPYINNLVLVGGDPMFYKSVKDVITLSKEFKHKFPSKNLVMFTGYTLGQLQEDKLRKPILDFVDVLIDGKFVEELKDPNLLYRGSSNQRIITLDNHTPLQ